MRSDAKPALISIPFPDLSLVLSTVPFDVQREGFSLQSMEDLNFPRLPVLCEARCSTLATADAVPEEEELSIKEPLGCPCQMLTYSL